MDMEMGHPLLGPTFGQSNAEYLKQRGSGLLDLTPEEKRAARLEVRCEHHPHQVVAVVIDDLLITTTNRVRRGHEAEDAGIDADEAVTINSTCRSCRPDTEGRNATGGRVRQFNRDIDPDKVWPLAGRRGKRRKVPLAQVLATSSVVVGPRNS